MYRPYHPFTGSQAMTPLEPAQLNIEVYPAGFVLRPGDHCRVLVVACVDIAVGGPTGRHDTNLCRCTNALDE